MTDAWDADGVTADLRFLALVSDDPRDRLADCKSLRAIAATRFGLEAGDAQNEVLVLREIMGLIFPERLTGDRMRAAMALVWPDIDLTQKEFEQVRKAARLEGVGEPGWQRSKQMRAGLAAVELNLKSHRRITGDAATAKVAFGRILGEANGNIRLAFANQANIEFIVSELHLKPVIAEPTPYEVDDPLASPLESAQSLDPESSSGAPVESPTVTVKPRRRLGLWTSATACLLVASGLAAWAVLRDSTPPLDGPVSATAADQSPATYWVPTTLVPTGSASEDDPRTLCGLEDPSSWLADHEAARLSAPGQLRATNDGQESIELADVTVNGTASDFAAPGYFLICEGSEPVATQGESQLLEIDLQSRSGSFGSVASPASSTVGGTSEGAEPTGGFDPFDVTHYAHSSSLELPAGSDVGLEPRILGAPNTRFDGSVTYTSAQESGLSDWTLPLVPDGQLTWITYAPNQTLTMRVSQSSSEPVTCDELILDRRTVCSADEITARLARLWNATSLGDLEMSIVNASSCSPSEDWARIRDFWLGYTAHESADPTTMSAAQTATESIASRLDDQCSGDYRSTLYPTKPTDRAGFDNLVRLIDPEAVL